MKLRGESGAMPSRSNGGIMGKGGSWVNPKYKEVGPSVKVVESKGWSITHPSDPKAPAIGPRSLNKPGEGKQVIKIKSK